jgi:hypothetical protein
MAHAAPTKSKINTNPTQPARDRAAGRAAGGGKKSRGGRGPARVAGDTRESYPPPALSNYSSATDLQLKGPFLTAALT